MTAASIRLLCGSRSWLGDRRTIPDRPLGAVHSGQNDSTTTLSKLSPTDPIDGTSPDWRARWVNAQEADWVPWSLWMVSYWDGRRC